MRYSGSEKAEIIKLVKQSSLSVQQTLDRLDIRRCTFYNWLGRYDEGGLDDCSRFIVSWRLCTSMSAGDVTDTLDDALNFAGLD